MSTMRKRSSTLQKASGWENEAQQKRNAREMLIKHAGASLGASRMVVLSLIVMVCNHAGNNAVLGEGSAGRQNPLSLRSGFIRLI